MRFVIVLVVLWLSGLAGTPARAEVAASSPGAFLIQSEAVVAAAPAQSWRALTQIGRWWHSEHTYSGNSSYLRLEARAGGCWCERWGGGSVEHARVVLSMEHGGVRTLRAIGALGPLQELGVTGIMTFTVSPQGAGAKITLRYSGLPPVIVTSLLTVGVPPTKLAANALVFEASFTKSKRK